MQLVVGRIGRPHGVRGEVTVGIRTDIPEERFRVGNRLDTDPAEAGPLTIESLRPHGDGLLVRFAGVTDRTAAERLRGILLVADSATGSRSEDPDEFWDHDLVGLAAVTPEGTALGTVGDVLHPPGPDLLVIVRPDGGELLVPFVSRIVPEVDLTGRRCVVDPPAGLLEL